MFLRIKAPKQLIVTRHAEMYTRLELDEIELVDRWLAPHQLIAWTTEGGFGYSIAK